MPVLTGMTSQTLVLTLLAPLAFATEATPFHWSGYVPAGKTISVVGLTGTIRAERATSGQVEVTARRSATINDPNEVQIQVVPQTDGGVKICAVYPGSGDCKESKKGWNRQTSDVKVEFIVKVPAQVHFKGTNVNGDIEIADVLGEAKASTVNGDVKVTASDKVEASTVNGNIVATVTGVPRSAMGFHTVNGSIDLTLSGGASAHVSASAVNGNLSTDFPITVKGEFGNKSMTGAIGSGGPEIKMNTVNGSVRLHRGA